METGSISRRVESLFHDSFDGFDDDLSLGLYFDIYFITNAEQAEISALQRLGYEIDRKFARVSVQSSNGEATSVHGKIAFFENKL